MQLWRCASCKRRFTPGPDAIHNKTYPLRTVISACSPPTIAATRKTMSAFEAHSLQTGIAADASAGPKSNCA